MKLYADKEQYKLYHGNMLDMLEVIQPLTIDAVVCDPPYELNFMGKGWDNSGIAFNKDAWRKCYEVLKPGGYLLAFGGSRTYHRIACAIEDAGFEIRDCIMYLYGSGFPKSLDISKAIDKKGGNNLSLQFAIDLKKAREDRGLSKKYCDDKYCNSSTNWAWYEGRNETQRIPDYYTYLKICEDFPELLKYKELIKEAEREITGKTKTNKTVYQNIGDKNVSGEINITIPSTDLAKQWNGWGTALKPAYEPIIVARKPFKTSVVENIMQYGVGGINIDECRVGTEERTQFSGKATNGNVYYDYKQDNAHFETVIGRFPANVIHDGSEEAIKDMPNTKTGWTNDDKTKNINNININFGIEIGMTGQHYDDSGSASRYFYCAKASKKDRDEGLDMLDNQIFFRTRPDKDISNPTGLNKEGRFAPVERKNIHPTVKPVELMQYLVRLVTPKNGTILDCFMGSGSTGKATMFENREREANYKFIGIELTEEYLPICEARIEYAINKYEYDFKKELEEAKKEGQQNIFDLMEE